MDSTPTTSPSALSPAQQRVLDALDGRTIEDAAAALSLSPDTIRDHLKDIRAKGVMVRKIYVFSLGD
jgi:DNA-binding CsgD family transcriptional regulator